ncbi:hypothetical protein [Arthrobacter sp. zg-Y238]|uniref:hypothetical protein n=1 Tax=Arthrobacter sp. zg-Y238 TaxID=2964614 RepID=UPI00351CDF9B
MSAVAGLGQAAGNHQTDREEGDVFHRLCGVERVKAVFAGVVANNSCRDDRGDNGQDVNGEFEGPRGHLDVVGVANGGVRVLVVSLRISHVVLLK